jgi:threonine dehydrogenase-like Zn-dependent dehydrogenase
MRPLLERIRAGHIDPSYIISHHLELSEAPDGYAMFFNKQDGCLKVVLHP